MTTNWNQLNEFDRWSCVRRLPPALRALMETRGPSVFVAGGYIRSCVSGEPINDIDVFASTENEARQIAESLTDAVNGRPVKTLNSWTLTLDGLHIQIIHRWTFADPRECAESFDFTIAKSAIWYGSETFGTAEYGVIHKNWAWKTICHPQFYADLAAKRLVYTSPKRNEDAGGSILRVLKFYQRGYRIPLDSLGAVIGRLVSGVNGAVRQSSTSFCMTEDGLSASLTGLLREVDPLIDPFAAAHIETPGRL